MALCALSHLRITLYHTLKHISPPPLQLAKKERGRACVQMNQCCLLYCFRLEPFQVAYSRESRRSCVVSSLSLYQTLGREGPSHSILSKPWSCLRGHASVWIEVPEYTQKVACSTLITSLGGKLPTFKVLIKPCRNGCGWQVYETIVVGINSLISIMHHQQIQLPERMKELPFAWVQYSYTFWDLISEDKHTIM